jgi:hydrogenase nickel incorporation protein HypA/HybF
MIMDELSAAKNLLQKSLQKADEARARRITQVYLVVGGISDYADESLQFHWDQAGRGTLAEGAVLHIRRMPAEVQCMSCFTKYHPKDGSLICPNCGGVGARIIAGEEFYIEALDME